MDGGPVTPWELKDRLEALKAQLDATGPRLESIAAREVFTDLPPGVGVSITRRDNGAVIRLTGAGARAHARRLAPRLRAAGREVVRP